MSQNYCAVQFLNDVMYLGIAVAKTKRLNSKAGFTLVRCFYYEGT